MLNSRSNVKETSDIKPNDNSFNSTNSKGLTMKNKKKNKNNLTNNQFDFTEDQILVNQISKVIKLRLFIDNISISDDKLLEIINTNINLINIESLKISKVNILVEDLLEIIKKEAKEEKEAKEKAENKQNIPIRKTLLSYNRVEYTGESNKKEEPKILKSSRTINRKKTMKFAMDTTIKDKKDTPFCLEGQDVKNKGLSFICDRDFEEMQEKIVDEISKAAKTKKNYD